MDGPNADFDSPWKHAPERYLADFTELFLLETRERQVAPESLEQELGQCMRDGALGLRRLDKLMRVTEPDSSSCLWHIEVQTASQADFAERMFICYYRLYERFRMPVRSIAILGDLSPTWRPDGLEMISGRTHLNFGFEAIKLIDFEDRIAELLLSDNVFAWLVSAHVATLRTRRELEDRMRVKGCLLTGIHACGWPKEKVLDVHELIDRMMRLPWGLQQQLDARLKNLFGRSAMPYMSAYEHRVEKRAKIKGRQEGRLEGRMEGREEGRVEGRMEGWEEGLREGKLCLLRQVVLSQLGLRFGPLDEQVQQVIAAGTVEDLERQIIAVLEAKSIEDVIGSAKH